MGPRRRRPLAGPRSRLVALRAGERPGRDQLELGPGSDWQKARAHWPAAGHRAVDGRDHGHAGARGPGRFPRRRPRPPPGRRPGPAPPRARPPSWPGPKPGGRGGPTPPSTCGRPSTIPINRFPLTGVSDHQKGARHDRHHRSETRDHDHRQPDRASDPDRRRWGAHRPAYGQRRPPAPGQPALGLRPRPPSRTWSTSWRPISPAT